MKYRNKPCRCLEVEHSGVGNRMCKNPELGKAQNAGHVTYPSGNVESENGGTVFSIAQTFKGTHSER